jgi:hypothetical protein
LRLDALSLGRGFAVQLRRSSNGRTEKARGRGMVGGPFAWALDRKNGKKIDSKRDGPADKLKKAEQEKRT